MKATRCRRRCMAGQSSLEYLVAAALLLALVAWPIDGSASAVELLLQAVRTAYARFLGALSVPM